MVLEELYSDLWMEFAINTICGLCGNHGIIPNRFVRTPARIMVFCPKHYCICPNGRALKEANETGTVGGEDARY